MGYDEFKEFIDANLPPDTDKNAFIEYLAMVGSVVLQSAMENTGKSCDQLIDFSFGQTASLYDA